MQEKRIDEGHQLNQSSPLNIGSLAEEVVEKLGNNTAIQIVYFDESDNPADSETRMLASFL